MPRNIPVGNGSLLVNFDESYQLRDIYWPHVGQQNHTTGGICRFGVWVNDRFKWLGDDGWRRKLTYQEDTLVTEVTLEHSELPVVLRCRDCVDFHRDVYLRIVEVENRSDTEQEVRLFWCMDLSINGHSVGDSAYFEPERRCLFHYKEKSWFSVHVARMVDDELACGADQWAVGVKNTRGKEGTWRDAEDGELSGHGVAQGSVDSTIGLHLKIAPGQRETGMHWFTVGVNFQEVCELSDMVCSKRPELLMERTKYYWKLWANKEAHHFACISEKLCRLYRRSLLILRTQIDNRGAILAANDFDIAAFNRDTYSYMWPRDGALVAAGLIDSGYSEVSRRFFDFCHRVITNEGFMLHKYNPDGSLASSWHGWLVDGEQELPVQEDETALVIWALWKHFKKFRDIEFVKKHYRGLVIRAANWLMEYRCPDTLLPLASWDLWEERHGVHGWTVGAVWGGLQGAANFAEAFGETVLAARYREVAARMKKAVVKHLWLDDEKRFCRSCDKGTGRKYRKDRVMDSSIIGLWYFGMFDPDDAKIVATMEALKDKLWVKTSVGGMARYESDYYHQVSSDLANVPGNPWFICTLWLAQWQIATAKISADLDQSLTLIEWCADRALESGVMAEQVDPYTNVPISVSPLTWSHATLVMTINEFLKKETELASRSNR
ncbi:glycoside hydrolase family 15 protein [Desulfosediminicola ganghwensis]|uniref:glycoside hydrolase family 15 protein n=1 Tax=Desulfosediminicola ganghwensis TaxID=2569540 RepID=UPI0010ACBAAA|nr:glycoside hydrolase family 15 protein [Desulfosediminicola ganghwensis]